MRKEENETDRSPILERVEQDPIFQENFRVFRAKFESKATLLNAKVVAVTSAIAGEGKTLSCASLAVNLASNGERKVLLVDADLRKCDLANSIKAAPIPGLSDYLLDSTSISPKDIIRNSHCRNLYVIPGGTRIKDPSALMSSKIFRSFIKKL